MDEEDGPKKKVVIIKQTLGTMSAILLDGLLLPCKLLYPVLETAVITKAQKWIVVPLCLTSLKNDKVWNGFVFWYYKENKMQQPQLYHLNQDTGTIAHCSFPQAIPISFELDDTNSWTNALCANVKLRPHELLYDFNSTTHDILVDGERLLYNASTVYDAIQNLQHDIVIVTDANKTGVFAVHLRGIEPQSLRLVPFHKSNVAHMLVLCQRERSILHFPDTHIPNMISQERDHFENLVRDQVNNKTFLPSGQSTYSLLQEDSRTALWIRYLMSSIPPASMIKMRDVRIRLLHVESAWLRFQGQILDMVHRNLASQARFMFHGVRAQNVEATTKDIATFGFNAKHGRVAVYGGGGIYCSPEAGCALGYVKNPDQRMQNHMFVCLALPGNIGYNGKQDQPMTPNQNSWFTLVPPYHVFSIEPNAILPIAEIIF